ncbi:MAG: sulfatase family protein [Segetibacter sp.]
MKRYVKAFCFLMFITTLSFAQNKPNILWVTIEDTSPQFIGCYGNKDARTPVIDKLAKEGVRFTNAFSTGTVCSPSRCTIITGVRSYKMGTGNHRSNYPIPAFIHGFPYYLQQAGYYTTNNVKTDYNIAHPAEFTKDAWNESSAKAGWWNRKQGQPFFAVFNFMDSHQSRTMTDSYDKYVKEVIDELPVADRIGDNDFEVPPFYRNSPEMRKQLARVYNALKLTDNKIGKLLKRLSDDHLTDSTIIFFYGDHGEGIPRGKTNGINLGYRVPFAIWFPPMYKNLSPWGTGVVTDEMVDFEDLAPTIISMAGGIQPDYLKGRTLIGNKRSKPVDHLMLSSDRSDNGIDMIRSITNGRYVYSRNYLPFMPEARYIRYMEIGDIKQQMRKDFGDDKLNSLQKSLFEPRPAEFLYDIENDQWETTNLVDNPATKEVLEKMRKLLDEEILQSRDVMFLPEYEIGLISKTTTPYEYRLNETKYPLKQIYNAASLSGKRGKDIAAQQIKLLMSTDKIIRYWAITGLRSQSALVLKPYQAQIIKAMQDAYPPVAVTASALSYNEFNNTQAEENLKKYSISENPDIALMSINFLQYVDNKQPFVNTVKAVHEMSGRSYDVKASSMDFLGSLGLVPNNPKYEE